MKELGFDNLINDFSKGLDQLIDPAGNRLASNKVNKLLLMRALINRPSLLVLDEPFLHLSAEEKRKVVKHIEEMSKNTTVIIATDDDTLEFAHSETIELR
jgi:ABC-type transport system involved in cytochrome bd biosynthesis fused ATPase/permease subunit